MPDKSTIWVDQTDLRTWSGNLTGIQRTVFELGQLLYKENNVRFFFFDKHDKQFKECPFMSEPIKGIAAQEQPLESRRSYARRAASRLPAPIRKALKEKVLQNSTASDNLNNVVDVRSIFAPNDVIVVLGGNWGEDHIGFTDGLRRAKLDVGVTVFHVIYDLIPIKYPNYYLPGSTDSFIEYVDSLIEFSDHLICISESTKRDLEDYMREKGISKQPVTHIIRLGENIGIVAKESAPRYEGVKIDNEFIICVGTIEARKNHTLLYWVVKQSIAKDITIPQILIIGRQGWMTTEIVHMIKNDPEVRGKLTILNDVKDEELIWFYKNCKFTIYPSMYEGWGLPLAEAANYGKLCLSSNASSMPEVLGDLSDYFSPYDPRECLDKIMKYHTNHKELSELERKLSQRKKWLWVDSYTSLKSILARE